MTEQPTTAPTPVPGPHVIVVMGATGDLSRDKLLAALYHLFEDGLLPERHRIIGAARGALSDEEFRRMARESVERCGCAHGLEDWEKYSRGLSYVGGEFGPGASEHLTEAVETAERELGEEVRRVFYLAVPPSAFAPITLGLGEAGLAERAKVVYEKPFGNDLASARRLNEIVHQVFEEEQVYRIDHFLGKETVQNILAFRFANGMFEPIWNRNFIHHVQIDAPEEVGVENRAAFYEETGALRDMVVTHLFQVLSFVAMEPPASFAPTDLIPEKVKVFKAITPIAPGDVVTGQYEGYRDLEGVKPDSQTETFVALRLHLDNWRWAGIPFYLRTGKRLAEKRTSVTVAFADPPRHMFPGDASMRRDHLTLDLGAREGVSLSFLAKQPGYSLELARAKMEFRYEGSFGSEFIQAYERLLHDMLVGDRTLFTDAEGIERAWAAVMPVLEDHPSVHPYPAGSWGPEQANDLIPDGRWHLPE